jgi:hypothetical protein
MAQNFNNTDQYVKRTELPGLVGTTVTVTDKSAGGSIGTAATTVDIAAAINVNQTTAGQTLTIPSPTNTTNSTTITFNNIGSTSFTVLSTVVSPGAGIIIDWTGSAWSVIGTSSGATNVVVAGGKTFTVSNTLTLAGTDGTTMTFPTTSATLARTDAANTFTGVQTMTSPVLITPTLGVATATSYNKVAITAPATGSTLVIADGKTFTVNQTLTLTGTTGTTMTFPATSATIARTDAANTFTGHQTIEGVTSTGATGTGQFVFDTTPTLTTPVLGVATATSINKVAITAPAASATLTIANTKTLTVSNTLTLAGTDSTVMTFPSTSATIARTDAANTFTGVQTMTSAVLITPDIGVATGTSLAATGLIKSSGTAGIGYATGAGGTVSQATDKSTGVTLSKTCGQITMNAANLAAATIVSFTLTNTTIAATDVLVLNHISAGTSGAYTLNAQCGSGTATISVRNNTAGGLAEAIVLQFVVIKAVTS